MKRFALACVMLALGAKTEEEPEVAPEDDFDLMALFDSDSDQQITME